MNDPPLENEPLLLHKLYLLLLEIVEISNNVRTNTSRSNYLNYVVYELLSLYRYLSYKVRGVVTSLQPKFHFLVHYGTVMSRHGPLCNLSSMRFESKNRTLRTALRSIANNINSPLSIAKKVQYELNSILVKNYVPSTRHQTGKLNAVTDVVFHNLTQFCSIPQDTYTE